MPSLARSFRRRRASPLERCSSSRTTAGGGSSSTRPGSSTCTAPRGSRPSTCCCSSRSSAASSRAALRTSAPCARLSRPRQAGLTATGPAPRARQATPLPTPSGGLLPSCGRAKAGLGRSPATATESTSASKRGRDASRARRGKGPHSRARQPPVPRGDRGNPVLGGLWRGVHLSRAGGHRRGAVVHEFGGRVRHVQLRAPVQRGLACAVHAAARQVPRAVLGLRQAGRLRGRRHAHRARQGAAPSRRSVSTARSALATPTSTCKETATRRISPSRMPTATSPSPAP